MGASSYEGGCLHGHLGIIMTNDEYFTVAIYVFPTPTNPGAVATVVAGMMASQITDTNRSHVEATHIYLTYHNVDQAFKKLIIDTFEDLFLAVLSDEVVGYANFTSLQFITHL
jgi:NADH:ubiquinone oxidoreductase subunit B-like Fe-S oxidoreductase